MSLAENGNGGLSAADVAAVMGSNNNGWGFGGEGGLFWLLVLFMFGFGGGWGNGYGGGYDGGYGLYPWMNNSQNINNGFRDQMINGNIQGIQSSITSGFGDVALGLSNLGQNVSNQGYQNQIAMLQGFNGMQSQFASCCCENRLGLANLGADIAREACSDRQAVSEAMMGLTAQNNANTNALINTMTAGFQSVKDQMCQDKIDAKNEEIANLRTQLNMQNLAASQAQQTAQLIADNAAQTQYVVNRVAPYPIPAYQVSAPYNMGGCGCGCGA